MATAESGHNRAARFAARTRRALPVQPGEWGVLLLAFCYFFCLLCGYYVLRPVRDEMGIQGGLENLQWLFSATFLAMLAAVPLFGWLAGRYPRRTLLPLVYGFFLLNILVFYLLFSRGIAPAATARVFFVWLSVFNLFVVSVFWSFMVDIFSDDQSKRLFGFIAAGGSAGAIAGPALTAALAVPLGVSKLLLLAAACIAAALWCLVRLSAGLREEQGAAAAPLGGGVWEGLRRVAVSPYLLGICLYVLLYTTLATFLYFIQAEIVAAAFTDSAQRTQVFALLDLATNVLTVSLQVFVTAPIASGYGLGVLLSVVPLLLVIGFVALALAPTLITLAVVQVVRRAGNYAIARPGREMLFVVLPRTDKYKSKNFIDTVVYRGGDAVSAWGYAGLAALGMAGAGICWVAVPVALLWLYTGRYLGGRHRLLQHSATVAREPAMRGTSP